MAPSNRPQTPPPSNDPPEDGKDNLPPVPPAEPGEDADPDDDEMVPELQDILGNEDPSKASLTSHPAAAEPVTNKVTEPPREPPVPVLQLGSSSKNEPIEIPLALLKRHMVILGASGSGKTVLGKCVLEEAALNGIPSIIIDPQGDLASLAITGDAAEIEAKGTDPMKIVSYGSRAEVRIFTPASSKGIPISANPLQLPPADLPEEEKIRSLDLVSSSLALLLGYDTEIEEGKAVKSLLFMVFEDALRKGTPFRDFDTLAAFLEDLPNALLEKTASVASEKDRAKLARNLRFMGVGMNQLLFTFGVPVKMEHFLKPVTPGKTPVNIIYLNTLTSDEHKQFFVTMVAREVYSWMLRNPSENPQLVLYIDEVGPYMPPNPYMPPAKDILRLLFKQGRKYGVSCLMNTQNAADVDYKAMAQAATWALGRMMTRQDQEKVKHILQAMNTANMESIIGQLPQLKTGNFVMICPDVFPSAVQMKVRWLVTRHVTLDEEKLRETMSPELLNYFEAVRTTGAPPKPKAPPVPPAARVIGQPGAPGSPATFPGRQQPGAPVAEPPEDFPEMKPPVDPGIKIVQTPPEYIQPGWTPEGEKQAQTVGGPGEFIPKPVEDRQSFQSPVQDAKPPRAVIGIPDRPSVLTQYQGPMVLCRLMFPQMLASKIAQKLTQGGMFEKVAVDKGEMKYLPVWQLSLTVNPYNYMNSFVKMFSKGKDKPVQEKVYINGISGKLLVIKDKFVFENVAMDDPTRIRDLDGQAQMEERPFDINFPDLVSPRIDPKLALAVGFKMFGVTPYEVKLVLIPVWTFTTRVEGKWVAHVKYVDGVFGLEIPDDPFSGA